jgi:hypothetical protein
MFLVAVGGADMAAMLDIEVVPEKFNILELRV